jgi:hypothetical protein
VRRKKDISFNKVRLLLHICCAPCLVVPLKILKERFTLEGYFYNPNIHPFLEYRNRLEAVKDFCQKSGLRVNFPPYEVKNFFRRVNFKEEKYQRCPICWQLRLEKSACFAKDNGFDSFSTTLLISPYQDIRLIKEIGEKLGQAVGVKFYYEDFRPFFRDSLNQAKQEGMYCQRYCGCIYSEMERFQKRRQSQ